MASKNNPTMFRYRFVGVLEMTDHNEEVTGMHDHLKMLDGFFDPVPILEYIHDKRLNDENLSGGFLQCEFDKLKQKLFLITEFGSTKKLSALQLAALKKECSGQWSDGAGESAFDDFAESSGFFVQTCIRKINVSKDSEAPFKPSAKNKAKLKKLKIEWEKAATKFAPRRNDEALLSCFEAIRSKDRAALKDLLRSDTVDLDEICKSRTSVFNEETLLTYAAHSSSIAIVRLLLDSGADPDKSNDFNFGFPPMQNAKSSGIVQALLNYGANPNGTTASFSESHLMSKCILEQPKSVKILLDAGADPSAKSELGSMDHTPLQRAIKVNAESARLIIAAGAKPDQANLRAVADSSKHTAKNQEKLVNCILKTGVEPDMGCLIGAIEAGNLNLIKRFELSNPLEKLGHRGDHWDHKPSPLCSAIAYDKTKAFELLIQLGADPNFGEKRGRPIAFAIAKARSLAWLKLVIKAGANLEPIEAGLSLSEYASQCGEKEMANYLSKLDSNGNDTRQKSTSTSKRKAATKATAKRLTK